MNYVVPSLSAQRQSAGASMVSFAPTEAGDKARFSRKDPAPCSWQLRSCVSRLLVRWFNQVSLVTPSAVARLTNAVQRLRQRREAKDGLESV